MGFAKPAAAPWSGFSEQSIFACCLVQCQKAEFSQKNTLAGAGIKFSILGFFLLTSRFVPPRVSAQCQLGWGLGVCGLSVQGCAFLSTSVGDDGVLQRGQQR